MGESIIGLYKSELITMRGDDPPPQRLPVDPRLRRERAHRTRAEKPLRCGACVPSPRSDDPEFQRRTI